ncbi:MAG: UDP-N-acetylglucosamine diphosphorylase [Verrucomicrobiota bacterium]
MLEPASFLDLEHTSHGNLFANGEPVWSALKQIAPYLAAKDNFPQSGEISEHAHITGQVQIGEGTVVEPGAVINGPTLIGKNCTIRTGAYIRGNVITGDNCTLGNSCEFKNCLLFDNCEVPHFNYVGDAILGYKAHLGAGVILSNVRLDRANIKIRHEGENIDTGLRKFSAIVGDRTEVGCNTVISPGSLLGRDCILYPNSHWSGILGDRTIVKVKQTQQLVERRSGD